MHGGHPWHAHMQKHKGRHLFKALQQPRLSPVPNFPGVPISLTLVGASSPCFLMFGAALTKLQKGRLMEGLGLGASLSCHHRLLSVRAEKLPLPEDGTVHTKGAAQSTKISILPYTPLKFSLHLQKTHLQRQVSQVHLALSLYPTSLAGCGLPHSGPSILSRGEDHPGLTQDKRSHCRQQQEPSRKGCSPLPVLGGR